MHSYSRNLHSYIINILSYKNTDMSHIKFNDYIKCLNRANFCVPQLIEDIHFNPKQNAKVTIVGAGPGEPELISIKGYIALENAVIILYDSLVSPALVQKVNPKAMKINVGKRAGTHHFSQDKINQLFTVIVTTIILYQSY